VAIALALIAGTCAARAPATAQSALPAATLDALDQLIQRGCYSCLEQAYEEANAARAVTQAFEAAALLTLRSKELGLPPGTWMERARTAAGSDAARSLYLEVVDTIPPDRLSEDRDALFDVNRRRRARDRLASWREALQSGPGSEVFREYLDVSLVCAFGTLKETDASFSDAIDPVAATPLLQYAIGNCDSTYQPRLAALRAAAPDFVDADFSLGRYAIEHPDRPDAEEGLDRLQSAAAAFPRSPAITTRIGNLHRLWEEWAAALSAFDAALAVAPDHPEATIGRAISLSQLERSEEAIAAATRLIDGGQWLLGEAYYWRAWNQLRLNDFQLARADADRARTLMSNAAVLVLSGVIEWRLGRLEGAEKDFQDALAIDLGECEAAFDLGVVRDELGKLPEAQAAFKQAGQCYDLSIAVRREAIQNIRGGPGTESLKAREAARHERVLADLVERRAEVTRVLDVIEKASHRRP
jgi:tetratricopeptide (TPR) repeat protein